MARHQWRVGQQWPRTTRAGVCGDWGKGRRARHSIFEWKQMILADLGFFQRSDSWINKDWLNIHRCVSPFAVVATRPKVPLLSSQTWAEDDANVAVFWAEQETNAGRKHRMWDKCGRLLWYSFTLVKAQQSAACKSSALALIKVASAPSGPRSPGEVHACLSIHNYITAWVKWH